MSQEEKFQIRQKVAYNVQKYRKLSKLNKEQLSLAINMDNSYISKLEKGKVNATIDVIEAIAKVFDISVEEFFKKP
jgi:transcriptional regulator with XRE-family HTH domain